MNRVATPQDAQMIASWLGRQAGEPGPQRRIEIWPDGAFSVARDLVDLPHRGFHASIKIGLSGDFDLHTAVAADRVSAAIVGSSVKHSTDTRGSVVATVLVDPESEDYARIAPWLESSSGVCVLSESVAEPIREELLRRLEAREPFTALWETVFDGLGKDGGERRQRDVRVSRTAAFLKENFVEPPSTRELASRVNLSVSRLVHLFTDGMGVSLRTYVHWLRMRDVLFAMAGGDSLTVAAHRAGFADLSHLTRKFRQMFGEPPSKLWEGDGDHNLLFVHRVRDASPHSRADGARIEELRKGAAALGR